MSRPTITIIAGDKVHLPDVLNMTLISALFHFITIYNTVNVNTLGGWLLKDMRE